MENLDARAIAALWSTAPYGGLGHGTARRFKGSVDIGKIHANAVHQRVTS